MIYNMESHQADMIEYQLKKKVPVPFAVLTPAIRKVLQDAHRPTGNICVWKEFKLNFGTGQGHNYVWAFHQYDSYGKFFDWVQVKPDLGQDGYTPAKVLLLYQTEADNERALVWMAQRATATELQQETNISARWKMDLKMKQDFRVLYQYQLMT
jgi:hypothetical protein